MKNSNSLYLLCLIAWGCNPSSLSNHTNAGDQSGIAERMISWENEFDRVEGWFGGDGIFTIPMNGKEFIPPAKGDSTLFIFSDSLIKLKGKIENNKIEKSEYKMIHNSMAMMDDFDAPNKLNFYWKSDENGAPQTVFHPDEKYAETEDYFWLGDGFVNTAFDSTLHIFAYRIRDIKSEDFFPFEQFDISIISIKKEEKFPFDNYEIMETDLLFSQPDKFGKATFGNGILVNTKEAGAPHPDGYIYIYGTIGYFKELLVSRVLPQDFLNIGKWTFWDGKDWNADKTKATKITQNVANELSMSPLKDGRFILVSQKNGIEPFIDIQMAKTPYGPFYPSKTIWNCDEVNDDKDYFAYNAKAHPSLSQEGELVISYNVNSFDFFVDVLTKANHYRPRFITLSLE